MRPSPKSAAVVVAATFVVGGLAACSDAGPRVDGPLDMPIDRGSTVCVQSEYLSQTILMDMVMVSNTSNSDRLLMDGIEIDRSGGLSVKTAHLIPWSGEWLMNGVEVPPSIDTGGSAVDAEIWRTRRQFGTPEGVINPGEQVQLAIELFEPDGHLAFTTGFTVSYHTPDGTQYTATGSLVIGVGVPEEPCANWDLDAG